MKKFFKNKKKLVSGFSLVETLVAVSIFTLSILALMAVLTQGIAQTDYAQRKITATYLGQEGIEYMRNMRDTYVLYAADTATGWAAFNTKLTGASCQAANGCYFNADGLFTSIIAPQQMTKITLTPCGGSCTTLSYDGTTGRYGYTGSTNSGFIRKISSQAVSGNQTKITSTVFWTQGSGSYNVSFSESLFNWIE